MAAQANMRSSNVLLINLGALGSEITKNIVLSGIGSLTILDSATITEEDLGAQFFISKDDVGSKRLESAKQFIEDLNPRVNLKVDVSLLETKDASYFSKYDIIIATDLNSAEITHLNEYTRELGIPLYVAGLNGLSGYIFVDLIEFISIDEKTKSARPAVLGNQSPNKEVVKLEERDDIEKKVTYQIISTKHMYKPWLKVLETASLTSQLSRRQIKRISNIVPYTFTLLHYDNFKSIDIESFKAKSNEVCVQLGLPLENLKTDIMNQFLEQAGVEISPVAAVIGGAVAQDIINVLGKRQSPLNNFVVFDAISLDMWVFEI